ncbi:DegT/DnrJ/EryC1/StrS family aminotransferase [Thermopirellula anaerolimosa]
MSKSHNVSRRKFLASASGATAGVMLAPSAGLRAAAIGNAAEKLALEGGPKAVTLVPQSRPRWGEPELRQLEEMLRQSSLFYWGGPQTQLLTERFQKICPVKYVQTCSSGTAALHIAVSAAGIGPGDEVITTPITDIGSVIGVIYQQAVPVFADLGPSTYNLDPADVERRITPKTKAIIAVHLAGNPCDLDALKAIADRHKLILIEDCCQAWGAKYKGRPIGTVGHFACFSLQNSKHVTCGDGGVVGTNDERFGPLLQKFGDKGGDRRKWGGFDAFATNYRMSEPQAAVAAAQLTRLESIVSVRSKLGNLLTELIADAPGVAPHGVRSDDRAVYWFYMFRLKDDALRCNRSQFIKAAAAEGANLIGGYIAKPLYQEPVFLNHGFFAGRWPVKEFGLTDMDFAKHSCPEAEAILQSCVRVLITENMTEEYIRQLAAAIQKVARYYAA